MCNHTYLCIHEHTCTSECGWVVEHGNTWSQTQAASGSSEDVSCLTQSAMVALALHWLNHNCILLLLLSSPETSWAPVPTQIIYRES